ncbi:MAG: metal-sensitive transcriptional regulator [Betaproteobacteria bacterium]
MAEHKHMPDFLDRLARVEGHIRGVRRMAEEGRPCEDVLLQIAAVRAALDQAGRILLEDHLESCVLEGIEKGDAAATVDRLKAALSKLI